MDVITNDDLKAAAAEIAEGQSSVNPNETRQPLVIGVTVMTLFLATVATVLRIHVRAIVLKNWGLDDSALVVSYVFVLLTGILMLVNTHYGDGLHKATLSRENYVKAQEISFAAVVLYEAAFPLIKSTLLLQYKRIFPLPGFQKICTWLMVFILVYGIIKVVSFCLACIPLQRLWDHSVPGKCFNLLDWWLVGSSISLFTDVVILCMPLPLLRTLPLAMKQKLILMATFGLGFFTCAISVIRITTLSESSTSDDATYNSVIAGIWSITELSCAIICVCIPTLRPLLGNQSSRSKPRSYLQANVDESADTELFTQSDGGVMSQKRMSRVLSGTARQPPADVENPTILIDYAGSISGVTTPPSARMSENREFSMKEMTMTLPLTRVETEDGVEFLAMPERDTELPTPLQPPPKRHIDRANRQSEGDYFGAVMWDEAGQASLPLRESPLPTDKSDNPP